jgi:hypothetical protein
MTKWMTSLVVAATIGGAAIRGGATVAQSNCADDSRRSAAIQFARAINTAETAAYRGQRSYSQLTDIPVGAAPQGMTVQLSTDGETYVFSIKDGQDPCHDAVFSDQTGVIYAGTPIR